MEWAVSERWLPVVGYEGFYEVVLAISTVSLTVSDLAARGGYGDWPV